MCVCFFYTKGYIDVKIDCYLVDASSTVFWLLTADLSFSTVFMTGHLHCWERPPVPASCCFRCFTVDPCSCCCKSFSYIWIFFTITFTSRNCFAPNFLFISICFFYFLYFNELPCLIVIFIDDKYRVNYKIEL